MKWCIAFLWTLLLCFSIISYSSAATIDPIVQPTSNSFEGSIFKMGSTWTDKGFNSDNQASGLIGDLIDRFNWNWWNEWNEQINPNDDPNGDSNVSPNPIPAAVWLLSSGLIGIVALRRKIKN